MKKFDSELFGVLPQPKSFDEVFDLILGKEGIQSNAVWMWRGQGDASWPMHSTAYRRLIATEGEVTEKEVQIYEKRLLKQADHQGYRFLSGRRLSDLELLALLRHHGAATRLIDATRNALVGLWFCAVDKPNKTGLLLGVHSDDVGGYEGYPNEQEYDEIFKNLPQCKYPQTWQPPAISPRVAAQHSQFLYSSIVNEKKGSLALPDDDGALLAVAVTPSLKKRCLEILSESFDIRQLTLFPDIDGFGFANDCRFDQWSYDRW